MDHTQRIFVHYGATAYDPRLFHRAENSSHFPFNKPTGGLWGSPIDSNDNWYHWCEQEKFCHYDQHDYFLFTLNSEKHVITIRSAEDYMRLPQRHIPLLGKILSIPDFEVLMTCGTGDENPVYALIIAFDDKDERNECMLGYDCDCVLVLDERIIEIVNKETGTK